MLSKINDIKSNFYKDMSGGLLAAIIGLPMGLAFGVQSGLGAQAGIYTAIILALVAAMVGGTKTLISDPTGPMTIVAATVVSLGVAGSGSVESALPLILGTFVLAGIFELIFGLLDFGKFVKFMPYPVVSSFMTGIGIIIISMQLFPFLGHTSPKGIINIMSNMNSTVANSNLTAVGLGVLALIIIYAFPRITTKVPSILVALIVCTALAAGLQLEVPSIGSIPRDLPHMHFGELMSIGWVDVQKMIIPAIMIGGLGVIDSLLTSVVADNMTQTKHNSRMTVIGQGIGNIVVGLFGGIPGAGATVGTVTNIKAGSVTRASGLYKGIFLLIIVIGVADFVELIPMSVLASILIYTGISIIDYKGIKMLLRVPRPDAIVWSIVLLFTVFNNLLNAVAAGFILACILFIVQVVNTMKASHVQQSLDNSLYCEEIPRELAKSIYVQSLDGPLFFGFADQYKKFSNTIDGKKMIIIRMQNVPFLDQSGIVTLESVISDWKKNNMKVFLAGASQSVMNTLSNTAIVPNFISKENCFDSFNDVISHIKSLTLKTESNMRSTDVHLKKDDFDTKMQWQTS